MDIVNTSLVKINSVQGILLWIHRKIKYLVFIYVFEIE